MFYVLQNESDGNLRRVPILLTDAATGTTAQTGIASTNIFPSVKENTIHNIEFNSLNNSFK